LSWSTPVRPTTVAVLRSRNVFGWASLNLARRSLGRPGHDAEYRQESDKSRNGRNSGPIGEHAKPFNQVSADDLKPADAQVRVDIR
jgi:hypothetical protein